MKERPILFSAPMVHALLAGTKTQTRRVAKLTTSARVREPGSNRNWHPDDPNASLASPYGQPGDRLRVKEHAWMWCEKVPNGKTKTGRDKFKYVPMRWAKIVYCADHPEKPEIQVVSDYRGYQWGWRKKLGRFLPKWASRLTLEIDFVTVERLNEISEADAIAEGIERIPSVGFFRAFGWKDYSGGDGFFDPVQSYRSLWESINGPGSWALNPYVWVIRFKKVQP